MKQLGKEIRDTITQNIYDRVTPQFLCSPWRKVQEKLWEPVVEQISRETKEHVREALNETTR